MHYAKSMKNRLMLGFILILIFVIVSSAGITLYRSIGLAGKLLGREALNTAHQAVKLIDVQKLEKVILTMDDSSAEYIQIQDKLAEYREGLGLEYLYTMTRTSDGRYMYLIDGMHPNDEGFSKLGDIEGDTSYYAQYDRVFGGSIVTNSITFGQRWGDLVSAYIPITNKDGKVIAFLGLDLKAGAVLTMIRNNTTMTLAFIIMIFLLGVVGASILAFRLTNPITKLRDYFTDMSGEVQNTPYMVNTRDEVGDIAHILNKNIEAVRTILNNTGEGLLTFGQSLVPNREYSSECKAIFNRETLRNRKFPELLHPDNEMEAAMTTDILGRLFKEDNELKRRTYLSLLPVEVVINGRTISLEYKILENNNIGKRNASLVDKLMVMVIARNISDKRALEQKIDEERKLLDMVVNMLVHINDVAELVHVYREFCHLELRNLMDSGKPDEELLYDIFREIHTFKGDFGVYGMCSMVKKLHVVEDQITELQKNKRELSRNKLKSYFSSLNLPGFLDEDMNMVRGIVGENIVDRIMGTERSVVIDYNRLKHVEDMILETFGEQAGMTAVKAIRRLGYRKFCDLLRSYPDYVERIGERLQKLVYVDMDDEEGRFLVDAQRYKDFTDSLVHVFRNAVDHGIEDPEDRVAAGKDEFGCIKCSVAHGDGMIEITISDDGRGLDLDKIRENAVRKGIVSQDAATDMDEQAAVELIFCEELSTKEEVTLISGRGMGLPAFTAELNKLGGTVNVETKAGLGTTFRIRIPDVEMTDEMAV